MSAATPNADAPSSASPGPGGAALVSAILARLVVPAWVVTGAGFKLYHGSVLNLPENLLDLGKWLDRTAGVDLIAWLGLFIAVELVAAACMLFVGRLARPVAICVLGVFCLVLIGELMRGNVTSCGCLGDIKMPPWAMLIIDGALLVALLMLPAGRPRNAAWSLPVGGIAALAGVALTVIVLGRGGDTPAPDDSGTPDATNGTDRGDGTTPPLPPPAGPPLTARGAIPEYFIPDFTTWANTPFLDTPFAKLLHWPEDITEGRHYVIIYSPSCEHCQELINEHIADKPPVPTIALAMPFDGDELPMRLGGCTKADLPESQWVLTPPAVIAIEDGMVKCAHEAEGEEPQCLIWR